MSKVYTTSEDLTSVADAIRAKSGTTASLTYPSGFVNAIQNISTTATPSDSISDVNFIDYDGTVLYSYTKAEANALTALPANPSLHSRLLAQGWNWTLAEIKEQLAATPDQTIWIGQVYTTTSGATEIDITLDDSNFLSPYLILRVNGTIEIDWGDNSAKTTHTYNTLVTTQFILHNYSTIGSYTIQIQAITGTYQLKNDQNTKDGIFRMQTQTDPERTHIYSGSITAIYIGNNCTISDYAFSGCINMQYITLPNNSLQTTISNYLFYYNYSLKGVIIPTNLTTIGTSVFSECIKIQYISLPHTITTLNSSGFNRCRSLEYITFSNLLQNVVSTSYLFDECYLLKQFFIPSDAQVTKINTYTYEKCYQMKKIIIPNNINIIDSSAFGTCINLKEVTLPNQLTTINNSAFYLCSALESINFPNTLTTIGSSVFQGCTQLISVVLPNTVTSIGTNTFTNCSRLRKITFSNQLTVIPNSCCSGCSSLIEVNLPSNLTTIGSYAFSNNQALSQMIIPSKVTQIQSYAFAYMYQMKEFHFQSTIPPSLGTDVFSGMSISKIIMYVPYSSDHSILNAYKTAENWSAYAESIQEEPTPIT